MATICQLLPWHHYYTILRYYLGKLRHSFEFQKQLVRVVVAVINSFHFDLSRADVEFKRICAVDNNGMGSTKTGDTEKKNDRNVMQKDGSLEEDEEKGGNQTEGDGGGGEEEDDDGDNDDKELEKELDKASEIDEGVVEERNDNDHIIFLTKAAASRVVHTIRTALLPQLQNTIYMRSESEKLHKVNKKMAGTEQDEEDILRVPVSVMLICIYCFMLLCRIVCSVPRIY